MKHIYRIALIVAATNVTLLNAQNVGINATGAAAAPSAMLDVNSSTKGLLIPNVALTALNNASPITSPANSLMVYNTATAGAGGNAVIPGYYFWDATTARWVGFGGNAGRDWSLLGNNSTLATTNFLGTIDNVDLVFKTNSIENMRILSTNGNVGIGTNNPTEKLVVENGNVRIGENIGTFALGRKLIFSDQASNSDAIFIQRQNYGADVSELNISVGDDYGTAIWSDKFNIGAVNYVNNIYSSILTVETGFKRVGINTYTPTEALDVVGSIKITDGSQGANKLLMSDAAGKGTWTGGTALLPAISNSVWTLTGNSGTVAGTNYIGTSDDINVVFKREARNAGLLDKVKANTAFGLYAFTGSTAVNATFLVTGTNNSALGTFALYNLTSGLRNTGAGYQSLQNTNTLSDNVAFGFNAGRIFGGSSNTFIGSGTDGVAAGFQRSTAIGYLAKFNASNTMVLGAVAGSGSEIKLGIGLTTPTRNIDVFTTTNAKIGVTSEGGFSTAELLTYSTGGQHPAFIGFYAGGTKAAPIYPLANAVLASFAGRDAIDGFNTTNYGGASINMRAAQNISAANKGSYMAFSVTPNNTNNEVEAMRIENNGFVGVGTAAPTERLHVIGNILASGTITPSDKRYKNNIQTLNNSLANVLKLRGVTYTMKPEFASKGFGTGTQVGVIAQEVEAIYPELINTSTDGYKGVDYSKFTPILIQAVKELNDKVNTSTITETQLNEFKAKLASQKQSNKQREDIINLLMNQNEELKNRLEKIEKN